MKKRIAVLSGGERARLCLAGLLLSQYNVLVLDEPGNHLDVDTVEALAEALIEYKGTVVFTSHDRHFMKRVATCIVEVRDGRVTNYRGDYDAYLYSVNKEIDDGEREAGRAAGKPAGGKADFRQSRASHPAAAKAGAQSGRRKIGGRQTDRQAPGGRSPARRPRRAGAAQGAGQHRADDRPAGRGKAVGQQPAAGGDRSGRSPAAASRNWPSWPGSWPKPKTAGANSKRSWAKSDSTLGRLQTDCARPS